MIVRRFFVMVFAATLLVGACGGDPPPPPPPPQPDADSLAAYNDSVAAAAAERRAEAERVAAEREAEAASQRAMRAARATLEEMVFFDYDMSEIRDDAQTALRAKVDILRAVRRSRSASRVMRMTVAPRSTTWRSVIVEPKRSASS